MGVAAPKPVSFTTLLKLGRVSNLPTVWTNVLAGTVLAGGNWQNWRVGLVLLAMSLFYVGGMYLNDYFDRVIDARERPERPIPACEISASTVVAIGFGLLGGGIVVLAPTGLMAAATGMLLGAVIVGYDLFHKGNPLSPMIMGGCRALVYCSAAGAAVAGVPTVVLCAALALMAYVAGLTYAARQESLDKVSSLWPLALLSAPMVVVLGVFEHGVDAAAIYILLAAWTSCALYLLARCSVPGSVSRAVGWLIAGISLVDAAFLAGVGAIVPALMAIAGFGATLVLQKYIAGT